MLERGFKSWAERTSISFRVDLGLRPSDPLPAARLAAHLDVQLCTPRDIPGLPQGVLDQLLVNDPSGWFAVGIRQPGRSLIIYNPMQSAGRQASDIMHELAHMILNHKPTTVILSHDGGLVMRSFDEKREDEANWLAWCLLLPRDALIHCAKAALTPRQIADQYGVSEQLVTFRRRLTGVEAQVRVRRR